MRTKFTKSLQVLTHLTTGRRQEDTAINPGQLMIIKPTCPAAQIPYFVISVWEDVIGDVDPVIKKCPSRNHS